MAKYIKPCYTAVLLFQHQDACVFLCGEKNLIIKSDIFCKVFLDSMGSSCTGIDLLLRIAAWFVSLRIAPFFPLNLRDADHFVKSKQWCRWYVGGTSAKLAFLWAFDQVSRAQSFPMKRSAHFFVLHEGYSKSRCEIDVQPPNMFLFSWHCKQNSWVELQSLVKTHCDDR